jgi:hypothetical protein
MSACRRHYPGRIDGTDSLIASPSTSAFPTLQLGQLLHYQFRGLLGVYSRYDLQTRQVALCDPLHRRLRRLCCLYRRSDCYRVERSSSRAGLSPAVVQRLSRRTVMAWFPQLRWMPSLIIGFMHDLVSGSAASTIQFLKGVGAAVVFIVVYSYWRWLPQPHSF